MTSLSDRKRQELERKLGSLTLELARWAEESAEHRPLEKHQSQIARVTAQLQGAIATIRKKMTPFVVGESQRLEAMILELHRVWDFFRSKLALRAVDWFAKYLNAADELAWECYEPALRKANAGTSKEPPLVFLSGGASPFAMARGVAYQEDPAFSAGLTVKELKAVLAKLPVPVVGVPWFQVAHLPEALVICHEVGHLVEDDLGLTPTLKQLLAAAPVPADRRPAWEAWLGEVFADTWGVLAGGPSFVSVLMDFLAADPARVAAQTRSAANWGHYPTDHLRVLYNLDVLGLLGFTADRARLAADWKADYKDHRMTDFVPDACHVARALLAGPYPPLGNCRLDEVIRFSQDDQAGASSDDERLAKGLSRLDGKSARVLFAAAALASRRDPAGFAAAPVTAGGIKGQSAAERILDKVLAVQKPGVRKGRPPPPTATDRAAGERLFKGTTLE